MLALPSLAENVVRMLPSGLNTVMVTLPPEGLVATPVIDSDTAFPAVPVKVYSFSWAAAKFTAMLPLIGSCNGP